MMRALKVSFPEQQALCIFPTERSDLAEAMSELQLGDNFPVIVLIGGDVSRKDIDLSLENDRPVIALSRTGRLADELSRQPVRHKLITVAPANAEGRIIALVQTALSINDRSAQAQPVKSNFISQ